MPPGYVKPYVKRNKHDAADAEAVCEAVRRPSMRFVAESRPRSNRQRSSRIASVTSWSGSARCSSMHCAATWPSSAAAVEKTSEHYHEEAARIRREAKIVASEQVRLQLMDIAQQYDSLADNI
jgi:transposase